MNTLVSEKGIMDALLDPDRLYNLDETNFIMKDRSPKVIGMRGSKHVYEMSYLIAIFNFFVNKS